MIYHTDRGRVLISQLAIYLIIFMALVFPTLEVLFDIKLHRIPYVVTILFALYATIKRGYLYRNNIFGITFIFSITAIGLITIGTKYSSYLAPLIYGMLFFIIMEYKYRFNFVLLYKSLLILTLLEFIFINIFSNDLLYIYLHSDVVPSYEKLAGKSGQLLGINVTVPNSIFYGVQRASTILAVSVVILARQKIWRYLSAVLFFFCFSLTSVLMLLSALFLLNIKKYSKYIIIIICLLIYLFYDNNSVKFGYYWETFIYFPSQWLKKPILDQLFGYPFKKNTLWAVELGYFFIIKNLGIINVSIIILLNLWLIVKKPNINSIIVTMYHISLVHYPAALDLGITQLFGLHIAHALHSNKYDSNLFKYPTLKGSINKRLV